MGPCVPGRRVCCQKIEGAKHFEPTGFYTAGLRKADDNLIACLDFPRNRVPYLMTKRFVFNFFVLFLW